METQKLIVGIDLGTTFSCCHFFNQQSGNFECWKFDTGDSIPSVVNFTSHPVVVGIPDQNAVTEVKRLIGLKYNDPEVQNLMNKDVFPYEIVEGPNGDVAIQIYTQKSGHEENLKPEFI